MTMTERKPFDSPLASLEGWLRNLIREELRAANQNGHQEGDKLLNAEKAAEILGVSPSWLYRYGKRLPFTRKLAPRVLRFSAQGIQKYLATRKNA
jgi:predicted DNA-binding transcriptional regulator AlpA